MLFHMEPTKIHAEWGKRVRRVRQDKDMTATDLAIKAGITRTQVWRIEKGHQAPSDRVRISIAEALQVDPDEIFSLKDVS